MTRLGSLLFAILLFALPLAAQERSYPDPSDLSKRLASAASTLLENEKKLSAQLRDAQIQSDDDPDAAESYVDTILYEDVISLLDAAIRADDGNVHAHALLAEVLLIKSVTIDGTYDICTLLDARDAASFVTSRKKEASKSDLELAQKTLKKIDAIPPSLIPESPDSCGDSDRAPSAVASLRLRRG